MRTCKLFLAIVLAVLPVICHSQSLFAKYCDMNNVSSVYISKTMIEMNPDLYAQDVNIGKIAKQLELVQILSTMDNSIKRDLRKDIESVVNTQKYEVLMKQKGIVSRMAFYVLRKGDKVKDLIMVIDGAASLKYIRLVGDMTLKDIQSIMNNQQTSMNSCNYLGEEAEKVVSTIRFDLSNLNEIPRGELKALRKELEKLKKELKNTDWSWLTELEF